MNINVESAIDVGRTALEIIACFLMPYVVWLHSSVTRHAQKIMLLEQKVNESLSTRLGNLEVKTSEIESKINKINETSIHSAVKIDSIEKMTQEIKDVLKNIKR